MNNSGIHKEIEELLLKSRVGEAIEKLSSLVSEESNWQIYTRIAEFRSAYSYLLEYMRKGMPDPNREALYRSIVGESLIINNLLAVQNSSNNPLYQQHRKAFKNNIDTESLQAKFIENKENREVAQCVPADQSGSVNKRLSQEHEQLLRSAFNNLWATNQWGTSECNRIYEFLADKDIPLNDRATLVSAVTLGLLQCFEPQRAIVLCRLSLSSETEISVRALVGLVIVLLQYEKRIAFYPELRTALEEMNCNNVVSTRVRNIQIQLLRCRETQKIDRRMREEIIPAMLKNPHLGSGKLGVDIMKEIDEEEQNPEWKAWIENDNIKDKLDEMARWQIEGADVYMSTFSQLKRYPFFEEMCNWFRPFDSEAPQLADIMPKGGTADKTLLGAICSSRFFCNSDKYSFCLTFAQIPQEQREMMMQQLGEGRDAAQDGPDTTSAALKDKEAEYASNQYIQDLYRFFKVSRYKTGFSDPFAMSLNLLDSPQLSFMIKESEAVLHTFNYLIDKEYYAEAINVGVKYENSNSVCDAQFCQKMGYAHQKEGNIRQSINYYTKADIINPDSLWTMRHIAQCYRLLGDYGNALHYYTATMEIAPDNRAMLLHIGECLAMLKRYEEAFEYFFKVEYLDPSSVRATRAIAWCSFLTRKTEQARRYYGKLMEEKKAAFEDYVNAAHVEMTSGNIQRAVELYGSARSKCGSTGKLLEAIDADRQILIEHGADAFGLSLLRDLLQ